MSKDPVHVRRRRAVSAALAGVLVLGGCAADALLGGSDSDNAGAADSVAADQETVAAPATAPGDGPADDDQTDEADPVWGRSPVPVERPSDTTALEQLDYLTGGLSPKSVMSSGHGLMIANNMMYSHTSTVFDAETREQVAVLDDSLDLAEFGIEGHPGISRGSPVEAVWTDDGRYAYVSQYTMYGENFGVEGFDACTRDSGVGSSFVYRFDADEMAWDQVIAVGAVPKYIAISPDQSTLLVSNWCDETLSVVDTGAGEEVGVIPLSNAPRGVVIMPDSKTAYAVAMYAEELYEVDIPGRSAEVMMTTALRPRHLNLTEDGSTLYLTATAADAIFKIDTGTGEIVAQVDPGRQPRSVAMSPDETALYVVNYHEASVSKIRTSDMTVIDRAQVDANPIGIDYDPVTNTVWVACYGGSIYVFDDQGTPL